MKIDGEGRVMSFSEKPKGDDLKKMVSSRDVYLWINSVSLRMPTLYELANSSLLGPVSDVISHRAYATRHIQVQAALH